MSCRQYLPHVPYKIRPAKKVSKSTHVPLFNAYKDIYTPFHCCVTYQNTYIIIYDTLDLRAIKNWIT